MSVNGVVYQVAIASPSDVREERKVIRDVVHDWNSAHSRTRKAILLPVGWETDVAPLMGGNAQDHIDGQMVKDSDLLIAVFWTRFGTRTRDAESGTAKEIKEFLEAGKPVMIYYNTQPARLSDTDRDQYEALQEFLRWCRKNGLISEYDGIQEFKDKLIRDLARQINTHSHFQKTVPEGMKLEARATSGEPPTAKSRLLSPEAQELLLAATKDPSGSILAGRTIGGGVIQTNSKNYLPEDARGAATWWGALQELEHADLIHAVGSKREVFEVTKRGYSLADRLDQ